MMIVVVYGILLSTV